MVDIHSKLSEATLELRRKLRCTPQVGIILGSGLSDLASQIDAEVAVNYEQLPHFAQPTALGHGGRLISGRAAGLQVLALEGRVHIYEGYGSWQIGFPVRVMDALGIQLLIVTNASGGLNPAFKPGQIVVLEDHVDLMGKMGYWEGVGTGNEIRGPRRSFYDHGLIERTTEIAHKKNLVIHRGVYAGVTGPNYETRAEYRFLRRIGADVVGMSTVPEVVVAAQLGLRVLALSVVTNVCRPDMPHRADGADVVSSAAAAEPVLRDLVFGVLAGVSSHLRG